MNEQNGVFILTQNQVHDLAQELSGQVAEGIVQLLSKNGNLNLPLAKSKSLIDELKGKHGDELIPKIQVSQILERCDSTLSSWARKGYLIPVKRTGGLYYRVKDVMKIYNGQQY